MSEHISHTVEPYLGARLKQTVAIQELDTDLAKALGSLHDIRAVYAALVIEEQMSAIQILTAKLQRDLSEMEGYWAKAEIKADHAEDCTD